MPEKSSIFDMIGPVMIGPSSSHTAGVVRIARVAYKILGGIPENVTITFYNSFARTYEGHGSDRAIIAGLLGYKTDDSRIRNSFIHAAEEGLKYVFKSVGNASTYHPNTIKIEAQKGDIQLEIIGISRGGGLISIIEVNGFVANFTASLNTLLVFGQDVKGTIAFIADLISHDECNIATMTVSRKGKSDLACQILEIDTPIREITLNYMKSLSFVKNIIYLDSVDE